MVRIMYVLESLKVKLAALERWENYGFNLRTIASSQTIIVLKATIHDHTILLGKHAL